MILVTTIDLDSFYSNYYFFSRKKRRRSWRIKNKASLKKISCVSLMRKLRDAFTNEIHPPLRTGRNFGRSHDTFECNHEYSQRRVNIGRGGRNSLLRLWSHERAETEGILTLMRLAAMLEQGETTALRQRSCTTKLQTVTKERKKTRERLRFVI